jgi:predicted MFS family arabinose efflux permease
LSQPDSKTPVLDEASRKSIFSDVLRATVSFEFAMRIQNGIFNNFAVEALHIGPAELGLVRGINEVPGLLTAPLAILSGYFKENVWAGICILMGSIGLVCYALTTNFSMLLLATIVFSTSFHLFYPVQSSIIMKSQLPEERATKMGMINSGAAAAALVSYIVVIAVSKLSAQVNFRMMHFAAALVALIGGITVMLRKGTGTGGAKRSIEFNKNYKSYYILTLLSGARRHITMTFAGFLLVQTWHTSVTTMVVLAAISSLVSIFTRPAIGKLIDNFGEQKCLVVNYLITIPLFVCYAFLKVPLLLYAAYVLDSGTQGFDVAIQTHMGKIGKPESLSSAYAMGSTIMHISGVSVPALGGIIWEKFGAPVVFVLGIGFALAALWYSLQLDRIEKHVKGIAATA